MNIAADSTRRAGRMIQAGRVTVTFRSERTGEHITITAKCRAPKENGGWGHSSLEDAKVIFFSVPQAGEGGWDDKVGKLTNHGFRPDPNADAARTYCAQRLLDYVAGRALPDGLEAFEEERCGCCGRALTDPVSVERGIGPECFGKLTGSRHQEKRSAREAA